MTFIIFKLVFFSLAITWVVGDSPVYVHKCCERHEILVDNWCRNITDTSESEWQPAFSNADGSPNYHVSDYRLMVGLPKCGSRQVWSVYHNLSDQLHLLTDGTLRHTILQDFQIDDLEESLHSHTYPQGEYCLEKRIESDTMLSSLFAFVCTPELPVHWTESYFMQKIVVRFCYMLSAIFFVVGCFLFSGSTNVGYILTRFSLCLALYNITGIINTFHEVFSETTIMITDIIMHMCRLGAFLWLSGFGHLLWTCRKNERSGFGLRAQYPREQRYYTIGIWSALLVISVTAVFAHLTLDTDKELELHGLSKETPKIGWLGVAIFFSPIAVLVLLNLYFIIHIFHSSRNTSTYFVWKKCNSTFCDLYCLLVLHWLLLVFSWWPSVIVYYIFIGFNGLLGPIIFIMFSSLIKNSYVHAATFLFQLQCPCSEVPNDTSFEMI